LSYLFLFGGAPRAFRLFATKLQRIFHISTTFLHFFEKLNKKVLFFFQKGHLSAKSSCLQQVENQV